MTSIYALKPAFQGWLRPTTSLLARVGVTANQITTLAAAVSVAYGGIIYLKKEQPKWLLLLPVVLFIRMALNAMDGMLAREHHMKSNLGVILNELGDVISDAALYSPLAFLPGFSPEAITVIVFLSLLCEMSGIIGIQFGASRRYDGPMGKSDRAVLFGGAAVLVGFEVAIKSWIKYLEYGCILLLWVTIVNRTRNALNEAPSVPSSSV